MLKKAGDLIDDRGEIKTFSGYLYGGCQGKEPPYA